MRFYTFFFLYIFLFSKTFAGNEYGVAGANQQAMGGNSMSLSDAFASINNPSAIGMFGNGSGVGLFYQQKYTTLPLQNIAASSSIVLPHHAFGLGIIRQGSNLINTNSIYISYNKPLGNKFAIGISAIGINYNIKENGNKNFLTAQVAATYLIDSKIATSVKIFNPFPYKLNDIEKLPMHQVWGISYMPSSKATFNGEMHLSTEEKSQFSFGVKYQPNKLFYLALGARTTPGIYTFGFGITHKNISWQIASSYHNLIGFSPCIGLLYQNKKSNK